MAVNLTDRAILSALGWAYDKAVDGLPGVGSASDLAQDYVGTEGALVDKVNSLILWQNTKAAISGFTTGLGGAIILPVAVPANLSVVLLIQVRMIAAIAIMGGHDVKDDRVKALVYLCMVGNTATEVLRGIGVQIGEKLAINVIQGISHEALKAINRAVGFRLLTKFGEKGVVNLGKAVPIVGAVVSAILEAVSTKTIGNIAKHVFIEGKTD